jgi:hypothetical protein
MKHAGSTHEHERLDVQDLTLTGTQAAAILGVSVETLGTWEERLGCPRGEPSGAGTPIYLLEEVMLLRDTLQTSFSVPAAAVEVRRAFSPTSDDPEHGRARRPRFTRRGHTSAAA